MSLLNRLPEHEIKAVGYILGSILSLIGQSNHSPGIDELNVGVSNYKVHSLATSRSKYAVKTRDSLVHTRHTDILYNLWVAKV